MYYMKPNRNLREWECVRTVSNEESFQFSLKCVMKFNLQKKKRI